MQVISAKINAPVVRV